ncbi:T9SS type A sorting domain-containing protein [Hymenobacter sp. BT491]|uniref:T9SS type A sorting domain-containing protein n=1 Tax=Hymenobacter sp. BT491 TaxID=2766779 RepID=UPI001653B38C|nr:T9SS type A sorting domain-containing protein [Hymenobacter sp. BT491]MBC6991508.1 T9SS type A sorting domain-containing protein [Hymenobacter sp. BT491]
MYRIKQLLLSLVLVTWLLPFSGKAQLLDPNFKTTELYKPGVVKSVAVYPDGSAVVLGTFTHANGEPHADVVRYRPDGTPDPDFRVVLQGKTSSRLWGVRPLPGGKALLLGYSSLAIAGKVANNLIVLNADGSPDNAFTINTFSFGYGSEGIVATAQPDGRLLVAGKGYGYTGTGSEPGIVRYNIDGSRDNTFVPAAGLTVEGVRSMVVQPDGKILVGGTFTTFNGASVGGLLRLNADGTRDLSFATGAVLNVQEIKLLSDGKMMVGGAITNQVGTVRGSLLSLLPSGTVDPTFVPSGSAPLIRNPSDNGSMAVLPDGKLVVVSTSSDVTPTSSVVCYLPNGTEDAAWAPTQLTDGVVAALQVLPNGVVLAGGNFSSFATRSTSLVALSATGAPASGFALALQQLGIVTNLVLQPDGRILISGDFSEINGVLVHKIARLLPNGEVDNSFRGPSDLNGEVRTLLLQADGQIVVGGTFTRIDGQKRLAVARLKASGELDPLFAVGFYDSSGSSSVSALAQQPDGKLLIAGAFLYVNGGTNFYTSVIRINPANGSLDPSFKTTAPQGNIYKLHIQSDGKVLAAGSFFRNVNGMAVGQPVVRLLTNGTEDPNFYSAAWGNSGVAYTMAELPDGRLMVGGSIPDLKGKLVSGLARLQPNGTLDQTFANEFPQVAVVRSIAVQPNGRLLVAGLLGDGYINNWPYLLRVQENGPRDATFEPADGPNNETNCVALQPDGKILIGGSFTDVGGHRVLGLARLVAAEVLHASATQARIRTEVYPNPAHSMLHVQLDAKAKPQRIHLLSITGKTATAMPVTKSSFTMPIHNLPAGVYLLRVEYASGVVVQRVVIE